MDREEVKQLMINVFKTRFNQIRSMQLKRSKKDIFVHDINELFVCDKWTDLHFKIYYKDSSKKYDQGITFGMQHENNEPIHTFMRSLSAHDRDKLIKEIYQEVHNYSLNCN